MAFRLPGDISDETALWDALRQGRDLVSCVPAERWATDRLSHPRRSEPGRSVTFAAGVLSRVDEFDAAFHGISPREAAWLDPQQRLLLELTWEAMENAGQLPSRLAGSDTAVYVGISSVDYGMRGLHDLASMTAHSMTGNTLSIAANRLSYVFDLRGPSMAVDTACSSSLVALHQACQSLRCGEAAQALVGGVNMLLHPYPFIGFTKASMISARGRSRPFDAGADGYVRSEGGAVLLLKPLDRALQDGDRIEAVILASGVNSDGRRKTGLTIPSSEGQAELMRRVLDSAGLPGARVDYVEAHGTGTPVGDPLEAGAIGEVYGRDRPAPLPIGSVKSNVGHLEPASGLAGLVKTVTMLKRRELAPSLHVEALNPRIDFAALNLRVVTECTRLDTPAERPLVMAVSSFGFGGTNAHVLLQEAPAPILAPRCEQPPSAPLVLSARSPEALRELAGRYASLLAGADAHEAYDIAHAAARLREPLEKRLWVRTDDRTAAAAALDAYARGASPREIQHEDALAGPAGIAFVYSGNGSQWTGMGRRLLADSPAFAATIAELDALIAPRTGFGIRDALLGHPTERSLDDTAVAQPLLFAMQVGITRLLGQRGIVAQAAAGHSVGEIAAAWAAGALTLEQAAEVICARSAAQALTRGTGRMAAVGLSAEAAREATKQAGCAALEIAGINGPGNVTVAGTLADLTTLERWLENRGGFFRLLDLDYAFHSRFMAPARPRIESALAALAPEPGTMPFVSAVEGDVVDGRRLDCDYWWRNIREPVRFSEAVQTLSRLGCGIFLEIGPNPILQRYLRETLAAAKAAVRVLPTLRRDEDGEDRIDEAAMRAHLSRPVPDLTALLPVAGRPVRLPNYPWQRERHWHPRTNEPAESLARRRVHPLLGWRLDEAPGTWENTLDPALVPDLADHAVAGAVTLPGAGYAEMALAAAREQFGGERYEIEDLEILAPIVFDPEQSRSLRFEIVQGDGGFRIRSRPRFSDDPWVLNALGRIVAVPTATPPAAPAPVEGEPVAIEQHYARTQSVGLQYGPAFRAFAGGRCLGLEIEGAIELPQAATLGDDACLVQPARLDACFQALVNCFHAQIEAGQGQPLVPVKIGRLCLFASTPAVRFHARIERASPRTVVADFTLTGAGGEVVATLQRCRFRAVPLARAAGAQPRQWRSVATLLSGPADRRHAATQACEDWLRQARAAVEENEFAHARRQSYFLEARPLVDALVVAYAHAAFESLQRSDAAWLQRVLAGEHPDPQLAPYVKWLVQLLQDAQLLANDDGTWRVAQADAPAPDDIWRTILSDSPDMLPELLFVGRVGRSLPGLIRGDLSAQQLLESISRSHLHESLFGESPVHAGLNEALDAWMAAAARAWPANRRLRILELSQGWADLPQRFGSFLPADRVDYVVAVADEARFERLEAQYRAHPWVSVARLSDDVGTLAADVRLPARYDVVIAHHWLHGRRNLRASLVGMRRHLADDGMLVVCERSPDLPADFVHGLDRGWWYEGTAGPASSLQQPAAWAKLMEEQGFEAVDTLAEYADEGAVAGAYLVTGRSREATAARAEPATAAWLLLAEPGDRSEGLARRLAMHMESLGQRVAVAALAREDAEAPRQGGQDRARRSVDDARLSLGALDHVVYIADRDEDAELPWLAANDAAGACCTDLLQLLQVLGQPGAGTRLWVVTSGGALVSQPGDDWLVRPCAAPLWGLVRVAANEYPDLRCTLIDLATRESDVRVVERLLPELLDPDGEEEIVLGADGRYGVRLESSVPAPQVSAGEEPRYRLDFRAAGQLHNLAWLPHPLQPLGDDEIEVRCAATGLNFRDVMYAMGLLPDESVENGFAGAGLGLEFAGTVTRVGARVLAFRAGDEVMGFGRACFASHALTRASALMQLPDGWSYAEAATVPAVFFTAYYALKHLAAVQPGERVLIHGAAGGVGIAAVQIARHLGAEVFATAGSDEKRDFVRLLGVDHVFDSRQLRFADDILAVTTDGVDVVLNSLAGEAINRNLRVLKPFGRFIELGKRDFVENTHVGLRGFARNVSYFAVDADAMLVARPQLAAQLFREIAELFRERSLFPLPKRVFPATRVVEAFRHMQQSRQIGKVVVEHTATPPRIEQAREPAAPIAFASDATYVVTGGLEGFGRETARWLARQGAGTVVLLGRRGMRTPDAAQTVRSIESDGARVRVFACDVADRTALAEVFARIDRELPPLRGIVHAAMLLDDKIIAGMDERSMRAVIAPKALGALNLHALSLSRPIDHFIVYSSVSTTIGNPGQANYVAANAFVESLAAWRRMRGLPATCVAWGPIGDSGYLARNATLRDGLASRLGAQPLQTSQALAALERMLAADCSHWLVADFDVAGIARVLPAARGTRFETVRRAEGRSVMPEEGTADIRSLIAGKSPEEVQTLLTAAMIQEVAQILGVDPKRIDPARSLHDFGMDSLMAVELALGIEKRFGVRLSAMSIGDGLTVERVAARLAAQLGAGGEQANDDTVGELVKHMAAQHDEAVSEEEIEEAVAHLTQKVRSGTRLIP